MRPAEVVVSMFSVIDRKPAPALPIRSMMCSTSFSERDRRSSFQTTIGIALPQMVEQTMQFRPVPAPAGRGFFEQASATGGPECLRLQGVVLFVPLGDAGIAEQRVAAGRSGAFRKRPFANGFGGHGNSSRICFQYPVAELR